MRPLIEWIMMNECSSSPYVNAECGGNKGTGCPQRHTYQNKLDLTDATSRNAN